MTASRAGATMSPRSGRPGRSRSPAPRRRPRPRSLAALRRPRHGRVHSRGEHTLASRGSALLRLQKDAHTRPRKEVRRSGNRIVYASDIRREGGVRFVIVGSGIAGMEAALALRTRAGKAGITIVSDEHDHLFSRPALMYVFAGQLSLRDTEPYDRGLFERMAFERV